MDSKVQVRFLNEQFFFVIFRINVACRQTTCVFNCQSVEVRLQCDEESMTFMKGLTKSGLEASEKMLIHSVGEQFPLECKKLLANLS